MNKSLQYSIKDRIWQLSIFNDWTNLCTESDNCTRYTDTPTVCIHLCFPVSTVRLQYLQKIGDTVQRAVYRSARLLHALPKREVLVRLISAHANVVPRSLFHKRTSNPTKNVLQNTPLCPLRSYARRDSVLNLEEKWDLVPTTCLVWGTFVFREWPAVPRAVLR